MSGLAPRTFRIGTRSSPLARRQTALVTAALRARHPDLATELRVITTTGDRIPDRPLTEMGETGVFTTALEDALRDGAIDVAVHSLKDLPLDSDPALSVAAVGFRADARDVLIAHRDGTLDALPEGARVGTSSARRSAQLLARRPDLQIEPLRGNVDTRVRRAIGGEGVDAVVIAAAGVLRLDLQDAVAEFLPFDVMLPAPGQGALAVQCRADDAVVVAALAALDDAAARAAVTAERTFLRCLGGGCTAPVGAFASAARGRIVLRGVVAARDGRSLIRLDAAGRAADASSLGADLARDALARGAAALLQ